MEPADLEAIRERHRDADNRFRALFEGRVSWGAREAATEAKRSAVFSMLSVAPDAAAAFARLQWHPDLRDHLILEPALAALGPQPGNTLFDALLAIALRHDSWRREPEGWRSDAPEARARLASLVRHLFAVWPVPAFLDAAWLSGWTDEGRLWRDLFVHVGEGRSLRGFPLPLPLTERGRHHFLLAPDDLLPAGALRWGQTLACGGGEALARALVASRLGEIQPSADEPFWESAAAYFIRHPEIGLSEIGPIVDFLSSRRAIEGDIFTMKGRTPEALRERVAAWHRELAKREKGPRRSWPSLDLPPFSHTEHDPGGATLTWTVVELTDTALLAEEGSELRHCVRSYSAECAQGVKAVFSLRLQSSDTRLCRRMLTIEVNRARRALVQVRGKANCLAGAAPPRSRLRRAGQIARLWARANRLGIACSI